MLRLKDGLWAVASTDDKLYIEGSTPTEAVAKLFLSLKVKDTVH